MRKFSLVIFLPLFSGLLSGASFTNGQAARAVIGQSTFTAAVSGAQQYLTGGVSGLAYSNGVLFVADDNRLGATPQNNRVLVFDTTTIPGLRDDFRNSFHPSPQCWLCGFGSFGVIGQADYTSTNPGRNSVPTSSGGSMNQPSAVATDGRRLAIADTDNNRVLIWNSIPGGPTVAPNIVLGQSDFTSFQSPQPVNANSLRGPQGVWIQNNKLFVADTQNHRILIWNNIPTQNNQGADLVLGQANLTTAFAPSPTTGNPLTTASRLLNPVSVTTDGTRLFVTDLGYNRVLIWNTIPTSNAQPADIVIGQPDMTSSVPNFATALCTTLSGGTYPQRCESTLNFPRFALSDGTRLFVADGGNDRVLIFNSIPTNNGAKADFVLGQPDFQTDIVTTLQASIASVAIDNTSSVDTTPTPTSLAFDGTNLYVSDPYNRRVLLFTPADTVLAPNAVVNWASEIVRQEGSVVISGTVVANDTATVTIAGTGYTYTVKTGDTLDAIARGLVSLINASDPNVTALFQGNGTGGLYLSSKGVNLPFDAISLATSSSNTTNLTVASSGAYLTAGTAATAAPGMLVEINGSNLSDQTLSFPTVGASASLPTELGGVIVFMDGISVPIASVSSTRVVAQVPNTFTDRNSTSVYVRTLHADGSTTSTTAAPVYIAPANPGLFNAPNFPDQPRPWPATGALHQPGNATAVVSIDGTATAGDTATITINGTNYTYTVKSGDTLTSIVNGLVSLIGSDQNVTAAPGGAFNRVVLTAKAAGSAGVGITVAGSVKANATVTLTPYTGTTCCDVAPNSPITLANPAIAGELIQMDATGLGVIQDPSGTPVPSFDGRPYNGPAVNSATNGVSATMNGVTAQVISAGLGTSNIGRYVVQMVVPTNIASSATTPVYIAQNAFVSNTVTIPVSSTAAGIPANAFSSTQVLVNPINLVFPTQTTGSASSQTQTVTISNPGSTATLNISSIQVSGTNAADFTLASNCGSRLNPQTSCRVDVTYTPSGTGIRTASLLVFDNASGSPHSVSLTGAVVSQFTIVSKATGKVLDVVGGSTANGAGIQEYDILNSANQKWSLVATSGGNYAIMNLQSGKVLDVTGGSAQGGALIQQWEYYGGANQQWSIVPVENGFYEILNAGTGKVLDVPGGIKASGTLIQQWDYAGTDNQKWSLSALQAYEIQNVGTGGVLDAPAAFPNNGTLIQQWQYGGTTNQKWFLIPVDNTYYRVVNVASGKVLDVVNASNIAGANIQEFDYLGGANQQWALVPLTTGVYSIVNRQSGRALDVTGGVSDNGTLIQQYDYLGGSNQQWRLIPIGTPGQ